MKTLSSALCAVVLLGPASLRAAGDTAAPGYVIQSQAPIPLNASFATLSGGGILIFDGDHAGVRFPPNRLALYVGATPEFVYPSFVLVHPTQGYAFLGESSNGDILAADFVSGVLEPRAQVPLNYDAVWENARHLLVSAASCVLFCGSEILRVDAATGAQTLVAQVTGPSGPLARTVAGDLYYGLQPTAFPPPPGSIRILRWTAAQIQSGIVLSEADATSVVSGLDGASALEIDPRQGNVCVANSRYPGGSEILAYRPDGTLVGQIVSSPDWIAQVQIRAPSGPASFMLRYVRVDYGMSLARLVTVVPLHPLAR